MDEPEESAVWFRRQTFFQLIELGWVVDGRAGGLVLGREMDPDEEIGMLRQLSSEQFALCGRMHGGEYLVNAAATLQFSDRLQEINADRSEAAPLLAIELSSGCRIINTHARPDEKFVWIEAGQFVINANSTAKHLDELVRLNDSVNNFRRSEFSAMTRRDDPTAEEHA